MENFRILLAALAALTLVFSVVSGVNPNYFVGLNAYAEDDEAKDDDNSGSNDEHEDEASNEEELVQSLGNHSKATLDTEDVELEVEVEDADLVDGQHDVVFACTGPVVSKEFAHSLEVEDGHGDFEVDLALANGTYSGCEVTVGNLSAEFPSFTILAHEEEREEEDEEENDETVHDEKVRKEHERDQDHNDEDSSKLKVDTEDDSIEIEVEIAGLNMTNGMYDATFICEAPAFNVTLDDALKVEDGEGKLKVELGLANSTYTGCELVIAGTNTVIASFDSFTLEEQVNSDDDVEEKRKEKSERTASTVNGSEIHERHRKAHAESPGQYAPGWNYTLTANGTASHNETKADSQVDMDFAVWKSNRAIILLDVLGGTVDVGDQTYTVIIGYALYSVNHDAMKIASLAVDEDGNVVKLKLRGSAIDEESEFPMESGSIDLMFEGNSGSWNDRLGSWKLELEGTVTA